MKRLQIPIQTLMKLKQTRRYLFPSMSPSPSSPKPFLKPLNHFLSLSSQPYFSPFPSLSHFVSSFTTYRSSNSAGEDDDDDVSDEVEWEEDDETEPEIDDGGAGGGIVLQNVPWGERVLSIAREVLLQFDDDIKLFAFKTSPQGYVYVRLDQLSKEYGCPDIEILESYNREYMKALDEEESKGEIPDLGVEVSSPGANRILRVPNDLLRFKDYPMVVSYIEEGTDAKSQEKSGVFYLDSIETESEHCFWKLADVQANRDPKSKGRPMSRKRKDWRLTLPFSMVKKVGLHVEG